MRIAFLCYRGSMQSGGQGIYLHALSRELAAQGHRIEVFVGPPYPDPMPWARVHRIENQMFWGRRFDRRPGAFLPRPDPWRVLHPLNLYELAVTRFGFFPEPFAFSVRAARAIARQHRDGARYHVVHDVQSIGYGLLLLQSLGMPVVTTVHHPLSVDLRSSLARDRSFAERWGSITFHPVTTQGRVARRLAAVITSSDASRDRIACDFRVSRRRIHNVLNGVELPTSTGPRKRPARAELLFVGRGSDPNKGLEYLLGALGRLPQTIRLRCLSEPPVCGDAVQRQIDALGLGDRVRFEGKLSRDGLEQAYREAAIVVLPSLFEGFGLPAIEALAAGTPVVASTAGALPEVLGRAGAGRLVRPRDPQALAQAVAAVLERWEPEQRAALAARPRIEGLFGWPRVADRTAEVYERVWHGRCA